MFILFFNVFTLFIFYSVYILQIYSVRWTDIYRKGQETLVENMYLAGKRKRRRKQMKIKLINRRAIYIRF